MDTEFDVIVVGGGLVGASFALALAGSHLTVAVIEPQAPRSVPQDASWDKRVYALSPANARWLTALGAWTDVAAKRAQRVESMRIYGDRAPARLEFSAYDAGLRELAWIVENRVLQAELWQELAASPHASVFSPAHCVALTWREDAAALTLEDGRTLSARLIVGADGIDSWVRTQAGMKAATSDYRETGVVANFETARGHDSTAFQWFREDGVLALLPLPGPRVSMVWSALEPRAQDLLTATPEILEQTVEAASGSALGRLTLVTPAAAFPLRLTRVPRLIGPRVALIGDAAHSVHPLAGQGVNLGFRDARELAGVLCARGPQHDCGAHPLLRRFERARMEDIAALELITDGLEKLFSYRTVWMAGLRNAGLTLTDAQPWLKNQLVRHAAA
jgi:ubiquinone biosynthesis UbiH/UbiF/VisC/COQ6 family hydroxylase